MLLLANEQENVVGIHEERIRLTSIHMEKPEGSKYYIGCRKVVTNLWKGKPVYTYVTASNPNNSSGFRLFLSTISIDGVCADSKNMLIKRSNITMNVECCFWVCIQSAGI